MTKFQETHYRSLAKAISLRIIIIIVDVFIIYYLTRSYDITLSVVIFTNLAETIIHFLFERVWNQIHWGKKHH